MGGKFLLRRRIAVGGMGEIWVAQNRTTRADVAIKILRPDVDHATEAQERFRHEARVGATLAHRSIVRVYDLVEEPDGTLILVMELLRGESVLNLVNRVGPRPADETVAIVSPILSALQHAHDAGIIHRDVSAANIFLAVDPDGQITPKLVDFGIAKVHAAPSMTMDGNVLGTPRYMSPEQIREGGKLDGRSDLFSMGVVLYEILTGTSPFEAGSPVASLAAVLERPVDPDPRIDPALFIEIRRALSKQAYERHESAREMATALRQAIGYSEDRLAEALRRLPPPLTEAGRGALAIAITQGGGAGSTGEKSEDTARIAPSPARTRWQVPTAAGFAGVLVVSGALYAAGGLRRSEPTPPKGPSEAPARIETPAEPVVTPAPEASRPADSIALPVAAPGIPAAPLAAASAPLAAASSPRVSPPPPKREPPRTASPTPPPAPKPTKGVATTPGF